MWRSRPTVSSVGGPWRYGIAARLKYFRFRNFTDGNNLIPTQISGKPSNAGFNAKTIRLQAIRTDTATLACAAAFPAAPVRDSETKN